MHRKQVLGLSVTAMALAGVLGFVATNSTLLPGLSGKTGLKAVDDVITVKAGTNQRLFVLRNDVHPATITPGAIRLVSQPSCGSVEQSGVVVTYHQPTPCAGHQIFTYCLVNGAECKPASVALRLIENKAPDASITASPVQVTENLESQVAINKSDLEISNVHLGRTASSETPLPIKQGSKLAAVAVNTKANFTRPQPLVQSVRLKSEPQTEVLSIVEDGFSDVADLTSANDTKTDATAVLPLDLIKLPVAPDVAMQTRAISLFPVVNLAKYDDGFAAPASEEALEFSPFGTECTPRLQATVKPKAMVRLQLDAPCQPNSRVEVRHGKVAFTLQTGHTGAIDIDVPAFEESANFQIRLQDGKRLNASVLVPELASFERLAIQWKGNFNLALHALEFGAEPGSNGHVWAAQQDGSTGAPGHANGFTTRLGDLSVEMPFVTEIYSLPTGPNARSGVVEMIVSATGEASTCGTEQALRSFLSKAGRLVVASGYAFKIPPCGGETRSIVLKNAVRDLIIASN